MSILKIGIPAGLQGTVFSLSNVIIQSTINSFGSSVIAGSSAAVNFEYIGYAVVNGFAQSATTFVGQNYGAKKMDRCRKIWKVSELLEKNLITALNSIDHKIIYEYLAKNIYSMTQTNFANYLKYLPLDEREKLIALRNKAYGVNPTQTQQAEVQVQTTQGAQQNGQNVAQTQPAQPKVATNPQTQQHTPNTKKADEPQTENPQTKFKAGETTKILNDGRVITSLGTSFARISDNTEEGFRIVDPKANKKAKEGAPIGMNDEVLVPGSQEWLMKYNKQAPKTAFTMAALEEQAEDTGLNLGSNHAKIGQPIKKKYNPNNFNIRG